MVGNNYMTLIDKKKVTKLFLQTAFSKIIIKHRLQGRVKCNYALAAFLGFRFLDFEGGR